MSYRQRVKLLRIDLAGADSSASELLRDSFDRLLAARSRDQVAASFAYRALADAAASRDRLLRFLDETLLPLYDAAADEAVAVGLKRALYHAHREAGARAGAGAGLGHLHGGALPAAARAGGCWRAPSSCCAAGRWYSCRRRRSRSPRAAVWPT